MYKWPLLTFSLLFLSFSLSAQDSKSCLIKTQEKIYHFGEHTPKDLELWKSSTCQADFEKTLRDFFLNASGPISASQLERILSESTQVSFQIRPRKLRLFNLKERLEQRFGLSSNQALKDFKLVDKGDLLLTENQFLDYECSNCRSTGEKSIELKVSDNTTGRKNVRWLKASSVVKAKALVPKRSLRVDQQGLTPKDFTTTEVETQEPEELFTNLNQLVFYRLNKPIDQGQALTHKDLAAINLVKIGTPVKIILNNKNLSLSYRAQALRAGKLGESVKLKTKNSNKVITGKVIDFNKVEIKL